MVDISTSTTTGRGNIFTWCFRSCCYWERPRTLSMVENNKSKWKQFGYKASSYSLPPIFAFLIDLYDGKDVVEGLESCRINPDYTTGKYLRNDLEYYIPQLTNFVVFHEDFVCEKLINFLEDASRADPYFAHCYYWYINSLVSAIGEEKSQIILDYIVQECSGEAKTQLFVPHYESFMKALHKKLSKEEYEAKMSEIETRKEQANLLIQSYKADDLNLKMPDFQLGALDLDLKSYVSPYLQKESAPVSTNPFTSTILFLEDLYVLAEEIVKKQVADKVGYLKSTLHAVNKALPSCVYIPFVKDSIRHYAVLNIVVEETRVFSTKERAPISLVIEIFRPQEELSYEYNEIFHIEDALPIVPRKKKNKLFNWAKKALNIKPKKKAVKDIRRDYLFQREPDEQFKVSNLTEMVSSPLTLKRIFRSQEGASYVEDRVKKQSDEKVKRQSTRSLVVHSGHRSFLDLLHQEEFKASTDKFPPRLTIPNRLNPARKISAEEDNDIGVSIAYQEEGSVVSSSDGNSRDFRSDRSSFNKSSSFGGSITMLPKQELRLSTNLNEPLWEEEKEGGSRSGSDRDSNENLKASMISQEDELDFFGEDSKVQANRIRENSPFGYLKSWRLVHVIVKTGADMKEEQFATQLISQFDQIFKDEKVKLILTPYEILSLGSDFGLVEVLKDAITMSRLKEKMYRLGITSLNEFFNKYYGKDVDRARKRFCRSLAAYSLVCYFLQIKDRHNGNILFHKQGHILHIDFGFLLSNSPGKGIEFERKVPFKLLNEYVEVLGGPRSSLFQEFRKLFYRGFMAARKHREQILILVKMMYSTQGANLPCFKAGHRAIVELEQRFCPPGVHERDLMGYCYNLINQSLDNWRAKCYDKYQYHFQGIFY